MKNPTLVGGALRPDSTTTSATLAPSGHKAPPTFSERSLP